MKGILIMSHKEQRRVEFLRMWEHGEFTVKELSQSMQLSKRQTYRVIARYTQQGIRGVVHRLRGIRSNRALPSSFRDNVQRLFEVHYRDYGPTLLSEVLLKNHGLKINDETLRGWFEGKWQVLRTSRKHRKKRERRNAIGEMIQFDGSDHDWLKAAIRPVLCLWLSMTLPIGCLRAWRYQRMAKMSCVHGKATASNMAFRNRHTWTDIKFIKPKKKDITPI